MWARVVKKIGLHHPSSFSFLFDQRKINLEILILLFGIFFHRK
jgi:hypothetical protein